MAITVASNEITATVEFEDFTGQHETARYECVDTDMTTYVSTLTTFLDNYEKVGGLKPTKIRLSGELTLTGQTNVPATIGPEANRERRGVVKGALATGKAFSHQFLAPKKAVCIAGTTNLDLANADLTTYNANFLAAGKFRIAGAAVATVGEGFTRHVESYPEKGAKVEIKG